jgi:hypothetical protein
MEAFRTVQPPDAENRTSGGVGGCRGAIPGTRPDHHEAVIKFLTVRNLAPLHTSRHTEMFWATLNQRICGPPAGNAKRGRNVHLPARLGSFTVPIP